MATQTLAERIAARKALSLQEETKIEQTEVALAPVSQNVSPSLVVADAQDLVKQEPNYSTGKPLTFSERRALMKKQVDDSLHIVVPKVVPATTPASVAATIPVVVQEKIQASILAVLKDAIDADDLEREEFKAAPLEVQQGYRDIKGRVMSLSGTDDDDLAGAMSELKKALLQNPNACLLMLDEDIGRMTIALRRVTQEAIVEGTKAKTEKKPGTKTKKTSQVPLSAEDMQKVFDEL